MTTQQRQDAVDFFSQKMRDLDTPSKIETISAEALRTLKALGDNIGRGEVIIELSQSSYDAICLEEILKGRAISGVLTLFGYKTCIVPDETLQGQNVRAVPHVTIKPYDIILPVGE